jgi:hypothetical protein
LANKKKTARAFTLDEKYLDLIKAYITFNKLKDTTPRFASEVVREALDVYFEQVDKDFWPFFDEYGSTNSNEAPH